MKNLSKFASKINSTQLIDKKGLLNIKGGAAPDPPPFGIAQDPPPFG